MALPRLVVLLVMALVAFVALADALGASLEHDLGVVVACNADYQRVPALQHCEKKASQQRRGSERTRCSHLASSTSPCLLPVLTKRTLTAPTVFMVNFTTTALWQSSARLELVQGPVGSVRWTPQCSRARSIGALVIEHLPVMPPVYSQMQRLYHARPADVTALPPRLVVISVAFTYDVWAGKLLAEVAAVNVVPVDMPRVGVPRNPTTNELEWLVFRPQRIASWPTAIAECHTRLRNGTIVAAHHRRPCASRLVVPFSDLGEMADDGCLAPPREVRVRSFAAAQEERRQQQQQQLDNELEPPQPPLQEQAAHLALPTPSAFLKKTFTSRFAAPPSCMCVCERGLPGLPPALALDSKPHSLPSRAGLGGKAAKRPPLKRKTRYDDIE